MKQTKNALMDALFKNLTRLFAFLVFILLAAILISLIYGSRESLAKYGLSFLWLNDWDPVNSNYGAVVPIIGTLLTSAIALIIAVPVSFGIAIFLTELSPTWLRRPLGTAIEMLAAIPSIIYGMWGLFVFVPVFQQYVQPFLIATLGNLPIIGGLFAGPPFGIGIFTAGLILSIMIIPFIAAVMRDVFELVPAMLKESAYGLGSTTWEVMWRVVLPFTKSGVIGGIMLGLGRDLRHRQRLQVVRFPVLARQLHRLGARQRIQRGGRHPEGGVAGTGPDPVPDHDHRAGPGQDAAGPPVCRRRQEDLTPGAQGKNHG